MKIVISEPEKAGSLMPTIQVTDDNGSPIGIDLCGESANMCQLVWLAVRGAEAVGKEEKEGREKVYSRITSTVTDVTRTGLDIFLDCDHKVTVDRTDLLGMAIEVGAPYLCPKCNASE
jgi:hypothetical protein